MHRQKELHCGWPKVAQASPAISAALHGPDSNRALGSARHFLYPPSNGMLAFQKFCRSLQVVSSAFDRYADAALLFGHRQHDFDAVCRQVVGVLSAQTQDDFGAAAGVVFDVGRESKGERKLLRTKGQDWAS